MHRAMVDDLQNTSNPLERRPGQFPLHTRLCCDRCWTLSGYFHPTRLIELECASISYSIPPEVTFGSVISEQYSPSSSILSFNNVALRTGSLEFSVSPRLQVALCINWEELMMTDLFLLSSVFQASSSARLSVTSTAFLISAPPALTGSAILATLTYPNHTLQIFISGSFPSSFFCFCLFLRYCLSNRTLLLL